MEQAVPHTASWPAGSSEMAERIRNHDWASTPLGATETWPQSLKTVVDLLLTSGFPMVALWGPQLIQIYNDGYRDLMGSRHRAGLGQPTRDCWPEIWHINEPIYRRVWAGETVTVEDAPDPITRSGVSEKAWFALSCSPLRDETGATAGVLVTLFEVTGRHLAERRRDKAETALRASEERLRAVLLAGRMAYWTWNPETDEVVASDTLENLLGLLPGQRWKDSSEGFRLVHPDDRERHRTLVEEGSRKGEGWHSEFRIIRPCDGQLAWLEERSDVSRDPATGALRISGLVWDITERKRAEEALRESEEIFRLIVENARNYAILMTDPQDRITGWFAGAASVFGWSAEEIIGQPGSVLYTPEDREAGEPEREIETARTRGFAADVRWHLRKDGRRVFIEGGVTALHRQDGSLQGFLKIGQNITERQVYEQALKASERHAKLLLAELQHRVRNTLAVIRSIARRTAMTSETVEDSAMHLEGRIDAFARVQTAVTRDPQAGLDLEMLVADELRAVAAREGEQVKSISGPGIRLHSKAAETFALATHELATNAVKYGALSVPEGRIEVIWTVDRSGAEPRLVFDWTETGVPLSNDRPRRRGFGTELIERTLSYELGGKAKLSFTPGGLRCTIVLPLDDQIFVLEQARGSEPH